MLMVKFLLGTLAGIAAHRTHLDFERFERQGTPVGWINLGRYVVGVIFGLPVFIMMRGQIKRDEVADYIMAFAVVGVGVGAGYWIDEREN